MFRREEGITRKHRFSFFSKLNPFKRQKNDVPQDSKERSEVSKKRAKLPFRFKRRRLYKKQTSKYREIGRPWWTSIGLSKRPSNNSLTPLKPFGTFAKVGRFV